MSRGIIAAVGTFIITRLFYWLSGFDPYRDIGSPLKYLADLAIWLAVYFPVFWALGVLKIGREKKVNPVSLFLVVALAGALSAANAHAIGNEQPFAEILRPVQTYMDGMAMHDFARIASVWHPNGKLFIMETMQSPEFLRNIPPSVEIEVDKTEVLSVDAMIAAVKVTWRMLMPRTIGYHSSYVNLIQVDGVWKIISETDYGEEKSR
jgi:hypothetical protein